MKSTIWKDIAELAGVLAILLGLYFVYEEIKQNGTIARAELSAESSRILFALDEQVRNSDFAKILAKSIESPAELTQAERLQMNSYLGAVLHLYRQERYNWELGIFEEWTSYVMPTATNYFGSEYGRAYWNSMKRFYHPAIVTAVDEALEQTHAIEFWQSFDSSVLQEIQQNSVAE